MGEDSICVGEIVGKGAEAHRMVRLGQDAMTLYVAFDDGEERVPASDLAKPLGYARPRKFYELVRRLERQRPDFGPVLGRPTVGRVRNRHGFRDVVSDVPMLTERQAILAAVSADTDAAWRVKTMVVDVFLAVKRAAADAIAARAAEAAAALAAQSAQAIRQLQDRVALVEADHWRATAEAEAMRAKLAAVDPTGPGTIGEARAKMLRTRLREAARAACACIDDTSDLGFRRYFNEYEDELRTHMQFPRTLAYRWSNLPVADFGRAELKAIQILEREKSRLRRTLRERREELSQAELRFGISGKTKAVA